jgi:hypothetical protein
MTEKTGKKNKILLWLSGISVFLMATGFGVSFLPLSVFFVGYGLLGLSILGWVRVLLGRDFAVIILFLVLLSAFVGVIPVPVLEKSYSNPVPVIKEEDDQLSQKTPPYISGFTEPQTDARGGSLYVNKSGSVIGLDYGSVTPEERRRADKIYPTFRAAQQGAKEFSCEFLPSLDLVDGFTKYFDDRLLAGIEENLHTGAGIFSGGKQGFLEAILEELLKQPPAPGRDQAAGYLAAAIELGGGDPKVPNAIKKISQSYLDGFLKAQRYSRPVGFYDESKTLQNIFRRDRFLQKPFGTKLWGGALPFEGGYAPEGLFPIVRIAEVVLRNPKFKQAYVKFQVVAEKVTDPEANLNLEDLVPLQPLFSDETKLAQAIQQTKAWKRAQALGNIDLRTLGVAFLPFSTSKENRLFARLYGFSGFPKTEIMNDLILAIKKGQVDLTPESDSGWYDYQLYALEALVLPQKAQEANKLLLHARYKKRLREAFEAMMTKRRETQVKQLFQVASLGRRSGPISLTPELTLEPCATNYLQTARGYRFLADQIREVLGEDQAKKIKITSFKEGLLSELNKTILLYYGFYLVVCEDIGMEPRLKPKELETLSIPGLELSSDKEKIQDCRIAQFSNLTPLEQKVRFFAWRNAKDWLARLDEHQFLDEDVRVIVPVMSNADGTKVRNWAVLGTKLLKIKAYYARPPKVGFSQVSEDQRGDEDPEPLLQKNELPSWYKWKPREYVVPVQVFTEITLGSTPMTRTEFRSICSQHETKDEIVKALVKASHSNKRFYWFLGGVFVAGFILFCAVRRYKNR